MNKLWINLRSIIATSPANEILYGGCGDRPLITSRISAHPTKIDFQLSHASTHLRTCQGSYEQQIETTGMCCLPLSFSYHVFGLRTFCLRLLQNFCPEGCHQFITSLFALAPVETDLDRHIGKVRVVFLKIWKVFFVVVPAITRYPINVFRKPD